MSLFCYRSLYTGKGGISQDFTKQPKVQGNQTAQDNNEKCDSSKSKQSEPQDKKVKEIGGPPGPEPTRYGDWEKKGRVSDF